MIDFLASHRHFIDHLAPLWHRLGGRFYTPLALVGYAGGLGVRAVEGHPSGPVVVASIRDVKAARRAGVPIVYLCHGIGQTYLDHDRIHDPGGEKRSIALFLAPNQRTADRLAADNPEAAVEVVGSPKLDASPPTPEGRVAALSFRWRHKLVPEAGSAIDHYAPYLARTRVRCELAGIELLGHGHPRGWDSLEELYTRAGIEPVRDFEEVVERATVYACDNSSTLYEWAALDRPCVVLNRPAYRRKVHHGMRFWEWADVGEQVGKPDRLPAAIERALDSDPARDRRREIAREALVADGRATDRAVAAIKQARLELKPAA